MDKIKILGIAASPRKGNTELVVKEALAAAESVGGIETEFVSLCGKRIEPCDGDYLCAQKSTRETPCPSITDDDCNAIYRQMLEADGLIVGAPVYYGGVTAQLKALFDRTMGLECLGMPLRNKVCGAVTVAFDRNGGQEMTIFQIITWAMMHDMIMASMGPERAKGSSGMYWGGAGMQGYPDPKPSATREGRRAVMDDYIGLFSIRNTGKRVAELCKVVKAGYANVPKEELAWGGEIKVAMFDVYKTSGVS